MNKLLAIRKEYEEPFTDVVRGFAEMGYSRTATAQTLNINYGYFRTILKRFNLNDCFKPRSEMRPECKGGGQGWVKGRPRPRDNKYTDEELLAEVRRFPIYQDFQLRGAMSATIVQLRFGGWSKAKRLAGLPVFSRKTTRSSATRSVSF